MPHQTPSRIPTNRHLWSHRKHVQANSSLHHVPFMYGILTGNSQQTRRYAKEIVQHDQSMIKVDHDGSVIIIPYSRQLPNEIISLILQSLVDYHSTLLACTLVNHQFHAIATPFLWKTLYLNQHSERFLSCLPNYASWQLKLMVQHIRRLGIHGRLWKDAHLKLLLPHLGGLRELAIGEDTLITDKSFKRLPYRCPRLDSLKLNRCHITELSFSAMGKHARHLTHLDWDLLKTHDPTWLAMFTAPPLSHLRLSFQDTLDSATISILHAFHRLTHLAITARSFPIELLQAHWPQLKHVTLSPCHALTNHAVDRFVRAHTYLEELHLLKAPQLTDLALHMNLPNLQIMSLTHNFHISVVGVRRLVRQCPRLAFLDLYGGRIDTHAFPELASAFYLTSINARLLGIIRHYTPPLDDRRTRHRTEQQDAADRLRELDDLRHSIQYHQEKLVGLQRKERRLEQLIQRYSQ